MKKTLFVTLSMVVMGLSSVVANDNAMIQGDEPQEQAGQTNRQNPMQPMPEEQMEPGRQGQPQQTEEDLPLQ